MTFRGTVKDGMIILDAPAHLPDGARVNVEPIEEPHSAGPKPHFHPVPTWEGPPGELDQLLSQVQELREADLTEDDDGPVSA